MKNDLANYTFAEGLAAGTHASGDHNGASIDHKDGPAGAFILNVGTFATSISMQLQYSDNNSDWTDEPDATMDNEVTKSLGAAGQVVLHVPNPRARYSRIVLSSGGNNVAAVINAVGPKRFVDEG